jgi:hypothetical protein
MFAVAIDNPSAVTQNGAAIAYAGSVSEAIRLDAVTQSRAAVKYVGN